MPNVIERRKFQKTSIDANNNKFYNVTFYDDGTAEVNWGRVGTNGECELVDHHTANRRITQKLSDRKGYTEILLNTGIAVQGVQSVGAAEDQLVHWIFQEANERISQTLAVSIDELAQSQIERGRRLVQEFSLLIINPTIQEQGEILERYYNTIPTQLPRKLDMLELISDFNPSAEEDRLNQLEAGLSTGIAVASGNSQYAALGAEIKRLDTSSDAYKAVADYVSRTANNAYRVIEGIYSVKIPQERSAFDANRVGTSNIVNLFHGTRNPNVRHILKSGLRVPNVNQVSNGSRFGRGIYFADKAQRSMAYTQSVGNIPRMMFIADVALGTPKKLTGDDQRLTAPPQGYDSVWGTLSHSGMDEFIVYTQPQQTIQFIVTFK